VSCGRDGPEPIVINLPTLPEQAAKIAELLQGAHADGFAWGDMAVLCRDAKARDLCASTLAKRGVPVQNRLGPGDYDPLANSVKVMTMKVSKGLEFPVVAIPGVDTNPAQVFKDPYFLDFLGLRQGHDEADLEAAILRQLEAFILELGRGFAFVERQKRMVIDGEDFYLDLLFFHRRLRRLVAIELKLGRFKAAHKGQMELYLKWLDKLERQPGEEAPIGPILCAESSREQGGTTANAQRRHHRGRILDRTATQSRAGAKAACRFA
jgi:hypothetical protein